MHGIEEQTEDYVNSRIYSMGFQTLIATHDKKCILYLNPLPINTNMYPYK